MQNSGVYKIRNLVNGKVYVGSSADLYSRKSNHFSNLKCKTHHNSYLQNAYNKHGKEKFIFEVIEYIENINNIDYIDFAKILISKEDHWIALLKSNKREYEYNVRRDASSNMGHEVSEETRRKISIAMIGRYIGEKSYNFGKHLSENQKQKISESEKGKIVTDEVRQKISLTRMGHLVSDETCKKISNARIGYKVSLATRKKISLDKEIVCQIKNMIDNNVSITKISKITGISRYTIYKVKNGGYKDVYGI